MADVSKVMLTTNAQLEKLLPEIFKQEMAVKIGLVGKPEMGGITGGDAKESKDKDGNIIVDNDVDLAYIALVHEFGSEKASIPQRSFLRSTYEEKKDRIGKLLAIELKRQAAKNNYDPESALRKVAVWMVGQVKLKFTSNDWDPLQNPSRRRRGKDPKVGKPIAPTPLVDTGQLRASIDYELVKKTGGPT